MSVIAFKIYEDKAQVAFDGRCLSGDAIESENYIKAYKISDSLIVGATGVADTTEIFKNFVEVNRIVFEKMESKIQAIPLMIRFRDALTNQYGYTDEDLKELGGFLIMNKQYHAVFYYDEKTLKPYPVKDVCNYGAFGSTGTYTTALIDAGFSLEDAIKKSAKKYNSVNGNVTTLEISLE
jgi:hypothetical protein